MTGSSRSQMNELLELLRKWWVRPPAVSGVVLDAEQKTMTVTITCDHFPVCFCGLSGPPGEMIDTTEPIIELTVVMTKGET